MEKELLEMSQHWKKTALEMLEKSEPASRSEFANQMLLACAKTEKESSSKRRRGTKPSLTEKET
jgi:hypothetical protein